MFGILQVPFQPNDDDCGYYVMKFMKDIVTHEQTVIPTEVSLNSNISINSILIDNSNLILMYFLCSISQIVQLIHYRGSK